MDETAWQVRSVEFRQGHEALPEKPASSSSGANGNVSGYAAAFGKGCRAIPVVVSSSGGSTANPIPPTRFKDIAFSGISGQKFPLHLAFEYFGGQFESEFFEEDLLVIRGF